MYPIPVSALPVSGTMGLISAAALHYVRLWLAKDIYNPSKSPFDKGDFWVVYSIHYVRLWLANNICRLTTITTDYYTNLRGSEGVAPPNYGAKLYYF